MALKGLAEQWESDKHVRRQIRKHKSAFSSCAGEAVPKVTLKEAIHNKDVILPALVMMGQGPKNTYGSPVLFLISDAETEHLAQIGCVDVLATKATENVLCVCFPLTLRLASWGQPCIS